MLVGPNLIKPSLQVRAITIAIHDQIKLDVGHRGQSEATHREVRATHDGMFAMAVINVVHLAVQQVGLTHRADFDFLLDPGRTAASHFFLRKAISERQSFILYLEGLLVGPLRIERGDEFWLAKKESQAFNVFQFFCQRLECVDSEVGRYDRKLAAVCDALG